MRGGLRGFGELQGGLKGLRGVKGGLREGLREG